MNENVIQLEGLMFIDWFCKSYLKPQLLFESLRSSLIKDMHRSDPNTPHGNNIIPKMYLLTYS